MKRAFLATENPFGRRDAARLLADLGERAARSTAVVLRLRREHRLVRLRIEALLSRASAMIP